MTESPPQPDNKILIADDHRMFSDAISGLLKSKFPNVTQVFNGNELLHRIRRDTPDLLLLDINLPGLNGLEAAQTIRSSYPDIRIIVVTMYNQARMVKLAKSIGLEGYILKDSPSQILISAIEAVLTGEKYFDPGLSDNADADDAVFNQLMLTLREKQVIQGLINGEKAKDLADKLGMTYETVKSHRKNIYFKLEISSLAELILLFRDRDLSLNYPTNTVQPDADS